MKTVINENSKHLIESKGLRFPEIIKVDLIVSEVTKHIFDSTIFYIVKASNAVTDYPIECLIYEDQYIESDCLSGYLSIGRYYNGLPISICGVFADEQCGYYNKRERAVCQYHKNGFFILELFGESNLKKISNERYEYNERNLIFRKFSRLYGCEFNPYDPNHIELLNHLKN